MTTIGGRVRAAMRSVETQQKQLAERVGMTPDALSRALSNQRGFAAVELAAIATELGVDVHELIIGAPDPYRLVILLPESGNWFYENWSLAHEFGHLALGHESVIAGSNGFDAKEREANAFAAELLLPEARMRKKAWGQVGPAAVAELVWNWGVSTDALRRRVKALALEPSAEVEEALSWTTQKLLRWQWAGAKVGDPITGRMAEAGERRFPTWLQEAHLERIAEGAVGKGTLAWMLGVPAESLEVDEPEGAAELSDSALAALLG